jgi:hypothetical protein
MGGIDKTIRKLTPKEIMSPAGKKLDKEVERTWESLNPKLPPEEAPIPMPDEEEIKRNKRRGQASRGGGRASTILTGGDKEALGG